MFAPFHFKMTHHSFISLLQESLNLSHTVLNFGTSMGMESPLHFKHTNGLLAMWSWYIQHTKVVFEIQANSKQTWSAGSISVLDKCIRAALFWCTTVVYMVLLPILGPIWHVISNLLQCYWSMNMNKYAPADAVSFLEFGG